MRSSIPDRPTHSTTRIGVRAALLTGLACGSLGLTGCQVDIGGQTLPRAYYLQDDIQYFPAGPEFKLSKEAAALKAATPVPADDCCN